jgi:phosphoserine phosphatase
MRVPESSLIDASSLLAILEVSRKLALPSNLNELLELILGTGCEVTGADRGTVFLYDAETKELYSRVATGRQTMLPSIPPGEGGESASGRGRDSLPGPSIRFSIDKGIAGECARRRATVVVDDCYADGRFNPEIDRSTGYTTRCLIAVPLIGLDDALVGVLQLLNAASGRFGADEQQLAELLAAQAAVAIQRTLLLAEQRVKLKLERDLKIARDIQQNVLVRRLPRCPGYSISVFNQPADDTGGDIYDVIRLKDRSDTSPLLLVVADAAGHGIGSALSVTEFRAMLHIGLRLSVDLETLILQINGQLSDDLPDNRFITAFIGVLDPLAHRVTYHAAGQGPLLHYRAASGDVVWYAPSAMALGMFPDLHMGVAPPIAMGPGDLLVLLTDGFYEHQNAAGQMFGEERVSKLVQRLHDRPVAEVLSMLLSELRDFAGDTPQADDITALLVKRDA